MREKKTEYREARRETESIRENRGRGEATVCNRDSRKREETSIGAAKRGGKASERASEKEGEGEEARGETMNGGVICNGISWQQWRIVWRDGRIVVC